jgi:AcrR family transcriptional regulator
MTVAMKVIAPEQKPRAGRPTASQAEARHNELLDRALDLFLEKGFELTTMEGVAAAVGMTKRTIYARYDDKAALFLAAVARAIARTTTSHADLAALEGPDLESTLIAIARTRIADLMTPAGLQLRRIINTESYRFPHIFTLSYEQGAKPVIDFLSDLLCRHDSAGAVCVDRPDMAANIFMSMVLGGPIRILVSGNAMSNDEIEDWTSTAVALFLGGIRAR